ncbi:SPOR domain-containing protein [Candidatus Enterovibrio altilux]|uniref:Cell division protein FtsN n=1 Tax=Candidatus Enterovibrio altilux TaxID=1927128 RepID=A0A291B957_9GAMM|nr:SPOR domain-containing protein [Candidatus Enterovibrio luxaltus]ATF09548.1 Cell division protein FtsN [Candidatus Enterovibrio luxaltus]
MVIRDYVKRSKLPQKPSRNKKKSPPKVTYSSKWAVTAVLLVSGLSYGLYHLSASVPPKKFITFTAQSTPKKPKPFQRPPSNISSAEKVQNTLPPQPKEKWTYMENLKNKEVKVEASEQIVSSHPYLIQCGAYRNTNQANERKMLIAFQGLESHIKTSQGEKGIWYRVVLGPYPLKREAERDRNMLRRAGIDPCAIWHWN